MPGEVGCDSLLNEQQAHQEADKSTGQADGDPQPEAEWTQSREGGQPVSDGNPDSPIGDECRDKWDRDIFITAKHPLK